MCRLGNHEVYIAIDAAAGVPAAAGYAVLHEDPDFIGLAEVHTVGDVQVKVAVAIGTLTCKGVVYIDKGVLINRLKFQPHTLSGCIRIQIQCGLVYHIFLMEESVARAIRLLRVAWLLHQKVMRKSDRLGLNTGHKQRC